MSVTYDHDAKCKTLGDAGFSEAQIAALMSVTHAPAVSKIPLRHHASVTESSLAHTIALSLLAIAGFGSLLTILVRVA